MSTSTSSAYRELITTATSKQKQSSIAFGGFGRETDKVWRDVSEGSRVTRTTQLEKCASWYKQNTTP